MQPKLIDQLNLRIKTFDDDLAIPPQTLPRQLPHRIVAKDIKNV